MAAQLFLLAAWCGITFVALSISAVFVAIFALFGPSFDSKRYEAAFDWLAIAALIFACNAGVYVFVGWIVGRA